MVLDEHVIYVTNDEDVYGTRENDRFVINGSTGDNAVIYAGNKGVDTLYFEDNLTIYYGQHVAGTKDLEIKYKLSGTTEERTLTIKDYFTSVNATSTKSSLKNVHYRLGFDHDGSFIDNTEIHNLTITEKKNKRTGTKFSEIIDFSGVTDTGYTIYAGGGNDIIYGTQKDDIIYGQDGNDYIIGNAGNDILIGGKGQNTYTFETGDGADTINLTKKETARLSMNVVDKDNMSFTLDDKGNAIITYDNTAENTESVTLKGFAKKNITNGAAIDIHDDDEYISDQDLAADITWDKTVTKSYKGSYLNENIDASGYKIIDKKTDAVVEWNDKLKGLTINGNSGNDNITGSDYIDTIKAGKGAINTITGGKGNDKLYAGTDEGSNTTFNFSAGDGHDTVYGGKGNDTLNFNDIAADDIEFERVKNKKGKNTNDLIIRYNHNDEGVAQDSVLIKNYYDKKGSIVSSIRNINISDNVYNNILAETGTFVPGYPTGGLYRITGTDNNDIIFATPTTDGLYQNIDAGDGDDIIYTSSSTTSIKTGEGNNTVFLSDPESGHTNVLYTGSGDDTIYGAETQNITYVFAGGESNTTAGNLGSDTYYYRGGSLDLQCYKKDMYDHSLFTRTGNDLTYRYQYSALTIKDYFLLSEAEQNKFRLQIHDTENHVETLTFNEFAEMRGGALDYVSNNATDNYIISEETTITGTDNNDLIIGTGIGTGTDKQTINAGAGNDIIYCSDDIKCSVDCGSGNDTIYGSNNSNTHTYTLNSGNNTVYVNNKATVNMGTGDDTIYLKDGIDYAYLHMDTNMTDGVSGNDTIYWGNLMTNINMKFYNIAYDDINFVREEGSSDLKIIYGTNSSTTIKDYYTMGTPASPRVYSLEEPGSSNTISKSLSDMIIDKGGAGDDLYLVQNLNSKTTIADNGGNDILKVSSQIDNLRAFFNVKKDGTFAEGQDKLFITNQTTFNNWTTGTAPTTGVEINDFDSIERINAYNNYYMTTTQLNQLRGAVAGWLTTANGGEGYADVATALSSGEAADLIAIFNNNTYWQQAQA